MNGKASVELEVTYQSVEALKPYPRNPRTHSKHQICQIAESIKQFGFLVPVLVDGENTIIAGHGRVAAAKLLGLGELPIVRIDKLTRDQIRAYIIADNKLAENAGWDNESLAIELQHLLTLDDFDVTVTGFEIPEIDLVLQSVKEENEPKETVEIPAGPAVSQLGDVWRLGKHRVLCGNSLQEDSFSSLMGNRRANVVFTDPPYNVRIDGNVCGKGSIHHREFAMASGEMSEAEFVAFLTTSLRLLHRFSTPQSVHFICMDWRHMGELLAAGKQNYEELLNLCVWSKDSGGLGSFYRSRHELIFIFKNGKCQYRNNVQLGRYGRNRTNVWEYPSVNTLSKSGEEGNLLALHPTVKPVALVADAILDCSARGDLVLDSFLGSGSTLIAAERVGRICFGIEIDPLYVDVAVRRWQRYTGDRAIHANSGKSFDEIAAAAEVSND
jgi:DNA modification methylase